MRISIAAVSLSLAASHVIPLALTVDLRPDA
jgi:hypothetical protein